MKGILNLRGIFIETFTFVWRFYPICFSIIADTRFQIKKKKMTKKNCIFLILLYMFKQFFSAVSIWPASQAIYNS